MAVIFGNEKSSALPGNDASGCLYTDYFKLRETPFSLTPDPRYLFMSERHREGLAHLLYGVQQPGGFVQLTGEIGTGKTTLCRCLIKQLPADTDVALILNPRLTVIELLATICDELRIPHPAETESNKVLIDALNQRLLETHAQGKRTVLIIDEAQNLHVDVLEQVRLLTNLETSREKLLQIILIGQPELLSLLKGKKLRQLAQRITARYHLRALSRRETYAYIQHRLLIAGRRDPLFTRWAMHCVFRLSGGMPRIINIICDRALLGAYALDKRKIGAAVIRRASRETRGRISGYSRLRLERTTGILMLAFLIVLIAAGAILLSPVRNAFFRHSVSAVSKVSSTPDKQGATSSTATGVLARGIAIAPEPSSPLPQDGIAIAQPRLIDILADSASNSGSASSFAILYALWGIRTPIDPSVPGCKAGETHGLECLFQAGNWPKLRRFDLPALLEVILPNGTRCRMTLVQLGNETATLAIGSRQFTVTLAEIDQVWDGSFIILWKPPFALRKLSRGDRGEEVLWIRGTLDRLEGKDPDDTASDLFDENLRQRIVAFQRKRSLIPDGYVGSETLVRLALALEGPNAPSISRQVRR
jgi:general secretion pathway protein A